MKRWIWVLGGLVVVGAAVAIPVVRRSSEDKARCHAEVTALAQWMQQLDAEGGGGGELPLPKGTTLVALDERAGGGEDGPMLAFAGDAMLVDGSPSGSLRNRDDAAAQLGLALAKKADFWKQMHPAKTFTRPALTVGIDQKAPWSQVATLLDVAARAGVTQVWFAFDGTTKLTAPPETDVSRALRKTLSGEAVDPSETARTAAEHDSPVRHVFASCEEVGQALEPLGHESVDPAQKNAAFLQAIPSGIEQCGCKVDMNEVKATQWARYDRYQGTPKVFRELSIAPRGASDATALTAPPAEPWALAHKRVLEASRRGAKVFFASE